jgi:hypothetical protein
MDSRRWRDGRGDARARQESPVTLLESGSAILTFDMFILQRQLAGADR